MNSISISIFISGKQISNEYPEYKVGKLCLWNVSKWKVSTIDMFYHLYSDEYPDYIE